MRAMLFYIRCGDYLVIASTDWNEVATRREAMVRSTAPGVCHEMHEIRTQEVTLP